MFRKKYFVALLASAAFISSIPIEVHATFEPQLQRKPATVELNLSVINALRKTELAKQQVEFVRPQNQNVAVPPMALVKTQDVQEAENLLEEMGEAEQLTPNERVKVEVKARKPIALENEDALPEAIKAQREYIARTGSAVQNIAVLEIPVIDPVDIENNASNPIKEKADAALESVKGFLDRLDAKIINATEKTSDVIKSGAREVSAWIAPARIDVTPETVDADAVISSWNNPNLTVEYPERRVVAVREIGQVQEQMAGPVRELAADEMPWREGLKQLAEEVQKEEAEIAALDTPKEPLFKWSNVFGGAKEDNTIPENEHAALIKTSQPATEANSVVRVKPDEESVAAILSAEDAVQKEEVKPTVKLQAAAPQPKHRPVAVSQTAPVIQPEHKNITPVNKAQAPVRAVPVLKQSKQQSQAQPIKKVAEQKPKEGNSILSEKIKTASIAPEPKRNENEALAKAKELLKVRDHMIQAIAEKKLEEPLKAPVQENQAIVLPDLIAPDVVEEKPEVINKEEKPMVSLEQQERAKALMEGLVAKTKQVVADNKDDVKQSVEKAVDAVKEEYKAQEEKVQNILTETEEQAASDSKPISILPPLPIVQEAKKEQPILIPPLPILEQAEAEKTSEEKVADIIKPLQEEIAQIKEIKEEAVESIEIKDIALFSVIFQDDETELSSVGKSKLAGVIKSLQQQGENKLSVVGYATDLEQEPNSARRISLQRAIAVRNFIISSGMQSDDIKVQALGEDATSDSAVRNRVDIYLLGAGSNS